MIVVILVLPSILLVFDRLIIKTSLGFGGKKMKKALLIMIGLLLINPLNIRALSKDETVYAKIGSSGKVKSVLVTEHLINNDKLDTINDVTSLTNIKNLNGNETFSIDGKSINWKTNKGDIYYQGSSDKELPIKVNVEYKLDGNVVKASDIKNKKGHVEIIINYTNNLSSNINNQTLYTPFVVVSEMSLNSKYNTNIKVTNGKVISNGVTNMVVALSSPGLNESLGIDSINLNQVTIEYDTTKFNKESIYAVATSKLIDSNDLSKLGNVSNITSDINELSSATNKLVSGASILNNGVDKLRSGALELQNGINSAYEGANKIKSAVDDSINNLKNDTSSTLDEDTINVIKEQAVSGASLSQEQLEYIGLQAVEGLKASDSYNQMRSSVEQIESLGLAEMCTSGLEIPEQYTEYCKAYNTYKPVVTALEETARNTAISVAQTISKSVAEKVSESVAVTVADKVKEAATTKTIDSLNLLSTNLGELSSGLDKLHKGSIELVSGIDTLKDGTNTLAIGLNTFNDTGIKKLTSFINDNLTNKLDTVKTLVKLSNDYQSYGDKSDDVLGTTKFIMVVK